MKQAFLNEPTIAEARIAYLTRWHLKPVQERWNGRKPSITAFKGAFGDLYAERQALITQATAPVVVAERTIDKKQALIEAIVEQNKALLAALQGRVEETEAPQGAEVEPATEARVVKAENVEKFPTNGMIFLLLHRAQEAGEKFLMLPLQRGTASTLIGLMDTDGLSYKAAATQIKKA